MVEPAGPELVLPARVAMLPALAVSAAGQTALLVVPEPTVALPQTVAQTTALRRAAMAEPAVRLPELGVRRVGTGAQVVLVVTAAPERWHQAAQVAWVAQAAVPVWPVAETVEQAPAVWEAGRATREPQWAEQVVRPLALPVAQAVGPAPAVTARRAETAVLQTGRVQRPRIAQTEALARVVRALQVLELPMVAPERYQAEEQEVPLVLMEPAPVPECRVRRRLVLPRLVAERVKDMGNVLEQETVEVVRLLMDAEPDEGSDAAVVAVLAQMIMTAPSFSLRGGTREILRGIIARGLGLR